MYVCINVYVYIIHSISNVRLLFIIWNFNEDFHGGFQVATRRIGVLESLRTMAGWGNRLSNATCLTQVFCNCGKECGTLWCSLTRRNTHKTKEAALDK